MFIETKNSGMGALILVVTVSAFILAPRAIAHCDTLSGPVITDARKAIAEKDVDLVLKWVRPGDEAQIRSLFDKTLAAREKGAEVQELVDMHFFETLVRVHRAGEGAPYTGLKPAGTPLEPGIEAAESAIESGSDEVLRDALKTHLNEAVKERFDKVQETQKRKNETVEAGRAYVAAYVDYIHFVEGLHTTISSASSHGHAQKAAEHGSDGELDADVTEARRQ